MTVPPGMSSAARKVSDIVREMVPHFRPRLSRDEQLVGVHLRGNEQLFEGLKGILQSRIEGRARVPEPSDPLVCKSMLAHDREVQWLLSRLEFIYRSPVSEPGEE
jgi:hypothetical protein